ncbi:hypothetical protein AAFF_G00236610 [Aldrovandia affinis]|uniref:Helitron helicase-like domain-containing protein n=1 Tax=Aldrovandia affinis TaxID=143900 RepID=A0AAD7W429_9TELE|nr:hypothetical protein AAFF_G00236610 [Aldrovandia affinis]
MRWPEFIAVIKAQQGEEGDFSGLDWNVKCEILRSNPVTVMRMFEKRVDALMTDLILSPAQPIGPVEDYLFRVEFQARGSPHIHMVVWIEDAPGVQDPEDCPDVIEFIDRYITCQMPDEKADPELHKIVSEVQIHSQNHSKTCRKGNVSWRFGFPRLPMDKTIIACAPWNDDEDAGGNKKGGEKAKDAMMSRKRSVEQKIPKRVKSPRNLLERNKGRLRKS